jgi:hypothetical protein
MRPAAKTEMDEMAHAPNAHDRGFLSVALLKPVADPEGKPLAIG